MSAGDDGDAGAALHHAGADIAACPLPLAPFTLTAVYPIPNSLSISNKLPQFVLLHADAGVYLNDRWS